MRIKLSNLQLGYLLRNLNPKNKIESKLLAKLNKGILFTIIEMDEEIASDIRDWALDKQDIEGFDKNYELNEIGRVLQDLADKFYID